MQSISGKSSDVNQTMTNSTPAFVPPSQSSTSNSLPSMNNQNNQLPPQYQSNNHQQLPPQNNNQLLPPNNNQISPQNNQLPQIPVHNQPNTNQPIDRSNLQPIQ